MKIYYVYSDYIEDAWDEVKLDYSTDEEVYKKLVREGKADVYSYQEFQYAFNGGEISDEGVILIVE